MVNRYGYGIDGIAICERENRIIGIQIKHHESSRIKNEELRTFFHMLHEIKSRHQNTSGLLYTTPGARINSLMNNSNSFWELVKKEELEFYDVDFMDVDS